MGSPRDERRLALLAMYQIEAREETDLDLIRATLDDAESLGDEGLAFADPGSALTAAQRDRAFETARAAYARRGIADAELGALSTEWRVERMPAIDRAILRLAHYEMTATETPKPRATVHEAVELAKQFSTRESPAFVNALLDRVLKRVLAGGASAAEG